MILCLYKCCKCNHQFAGYPGGMSCEACGHGYVIWVNYNDTDWV